MTGRGTGRSSASLKSQKSRPGRVAEEELVRAFARLRDRHALAASEFRQVVEGEAHGIGNRLVLQPHHFREEAEEVVEGKDPLVMIGADLARHPTSPLELVRIRGVVLVVADRERLDRRRIAFGEERSIRARVDAARQEHADRHVADLPKLHRDAQLVEHALLDLAVGHADERLDVVPASHQRRSSVRPSASTRNQQPGSSFRIPRRACAAPAHSRNER